MAEQFDKYSIGGLMRCCTETLGDLYPDGPARIAEEEQTLSCKYAPNNPTHKMIFRGGTWRWDQPHD